MDKVEDDPTLLLKECHSLAKSISAGVEDVIVTGRRICNEISKPQFASDDTLHVGRESVRPLIELKNIATELFVDLETFNISNSNFKDIDLEPAFQKMEEDMKKDLDFAKKSNEFLRKLNFITEVILYLECDDKSETSKPVSTLSAAASHPSREVPNVDSKSDEADEPVSTLSEAANRPSRKVHNVASKSDTGKTALRSYDDLTETRQEKQDDRRKLLETFEVLMELRKTARATKEVEDEPTRLLREAHNLAKSISAGVKDVITTGRRICNETRDIKFQFPSDVDNSFHIGRESVRPLIELKNIATEVFADLETTSIDNINFTEDIDLEPAFQKMKEDMKKSIDFAKKSNECLTKLNFITEVLLYLELDDENETDESVSTLSEEDASRPSQEVHNVASKSDIGKTELRSYDNSTAMRWEKENEISRLLLEAHNIASSIGISLEVIGTEKYGEEMDIKYEFLFEDSLNIDRESMSPLIEFENIVAKMFADIAKDEEEMKNFIYRKEQFIKQLNSAEEIIANLQIDRETVRTESALSETRNFEASKSSLCYVIS